MSLGKRNRGAGHKWERDCKNRFIEIGFPHVVTSRSESRSTDARKIDLMNSRERLNGVFPFAVQCKSYSSRLDYHKLMEEIDSDEIKVILHRFTKKAKTKFMTQGEYAILKIDDFFNLIKQLNEQKPI